MTNWGYCLDLMMGLLTMMAQRKVLLKAEQIEKDHCLVVSLVLLTRMALQMAAMRGLH